MPDIGSLVSFLGWTALIAVPLALWKAAEIVWWLITHVSVTVQ